jgi:hypothetical protein
MLAKFGILSPGILITNLICWENQWHFEKKKIFDLYSFMKLRIKSRDLFNVLEECNNVYA